MSLLLLLNCLPLPAFRFIVSWCVFNLEILIPSSYFCHTSLKPTVFERSIMVPWRQRYAHFEKKSA